MDNTVETYIESLYERDSDLERVLVWIEQQGMPQISVPPGYGRLLTLLVRMSGAKKVLEIGALGGYSGICLARGLHEEGKLLSLEINAEFADTARAHLEAAGLGHKVEYRIGDAKETLRELEQEGETFDFFFIDADKAAYPFYLEMALKLAEPGAVIVADNTLMRGKTVDPNQTSKRVLAMREFNRTVARHPRLESTLLPAYDGLAIARVKSV